jgi:membrane-associated phospholipid phosphatase
VSIPEAEPERSRIRPRWVEDAERLDLAVYAAVAGTPTPALDSAMSRLSRAADYSRLSLASAAALGLAGGRPGRHAAAMGLSSLAVTATVVNAVVKPLGRRSRPDRAGREVPLERQVDMPHSRSFPSGHSAGAFAFATGVGRTMPRAAVPLRALAALVAYSRVHTGVHYPGDVLAGSLLGTALAQLTTHGLAHRAGRSQGPRRLMSSAAGGRRTRRGRR